MEWGGGANLLCSLRITLGIQNEPETTGSAGAAVPDLRKNGTEAMEEVAAPLAVAAPPLGTTDPQTVAGAAQGTAGRNLQQNLPAQTQNLPREE